MSENLKKTSLHEIHTRLQAKMAPFAGFDMPIQYSGIRAEHEAVRKNAGLFDVSHMGNFFVSGPDALTYLQKLTTNNVALLSPGDVQYSALCLPNGCVIDDILVYALQPNVYMVVVNASNIEKDWKWFEEHRGGAKVHTENRSVETAIISLQGPKADSILREISPDLPQLGNYKCGTATVAGLKINLARTGYTGEDGYELFPHAKDAPAIWEALTKVGGLQGLLPVGLGARDTLRLEAGYSLYGHELNETINPLEAGLGWITALDKGEFMGRDSLLKIKAAGLKRKLTGLEMTETAIPRDGFSVHRAGRIVGVVTSGTQSPTLGKGIALALIETESTDKGTELQVNIRGVLKNAKAVPRTFYKRPKTMVGA